MNKRTSHFKVYIFILILIICVNFLPTVSNAKNNDLHSIPKSIHELPNGYYSGTLPIGQSFNTPVGRVSSFRDIDIAGIVILTAEYRALYQEGLSIHLTITGNGQSRSQTVTRPNYGDYLLTRVSIQDTKEFSDAVVIWRYGYLY